MEKTIIFRSLLVILILSSIVDASFIRITMTSETPQIITENNFQMKFTMMNTGDESAHEVQVELLLPQGFTSHPIYFGTIEPNIEYTNDFNISISEVVLPGLYHSAIKLNYADQNAYPFSHMGQAVFRYQDPSSSQISAVIQSMNLSVQGEVKKLVLNIQNRDVKPLDLNIRYFIPDEVKASEYTKKISINAKSMAEVDIDVEGFGVLPNSAYVLLANIEYDLDGRHYSTLANGVISFQENAEDNLPIPTWMIFSLIALLLGIFFTYQLGFFTKKK